MCLLFKDLIGILSQIDKNRTQLINKGGLFVAVREQKMIQFTKKKYFIKIDNDIFFVHIGIIFL